MPTAVDGAKRPLVAVDLYWLPLGAGGHSVRLNGKVFDLYHAALEVPAPVWGRDELGAGEMWNSNSVISWLLVSSGLDEESVRMPLGGRAPGWDPGLVVARRQGPGSATRAGNDA